jgi:hypothetical protein
MAERLQKRQVIPVLRGKRWHISSLIYLNVVISMLIDIVSEAQNCVMQVSS